ncbi:restriction endonuclease [Gallibacterium salpingitidis]|uniref:DEAD/DEAH box helicase n=1 Tax=Gallibacterium salpingitidis TaxID=505341 RepID=UPI00266F5C82|nr:restriction endonuclease [Gallibacterium salpingitidis]WKS99249.1 restriction endonuclease [Gallibacterium salpingitidis]
MANNYLSPLQQPKIYAYSDSRYPNMLKVGYTERDVETRIAEQYPIKTPSKSYQIVINELAVREDGSYFNDYEVHQTLQKMGVKRSEGEWFVSDRETVMAAIIAVRNRKMPQKNRILDFAMRPEQQAAVARTKAYFTSFRNDPKNKNKDPKFLWNAKMRFGKTFATYQLVKEMNWRRILILTFKPAVKTAWQEDLQRHIDFTDWQFIDKQNIDQAEILKKRSEQLNKPMICFLSLQDLHGRTSTGKIKARNRWIYEINWDCVVFDEYHYGAWRNKTKEQFDDGELNTELADQLAFEEEILGLTPYHYLYLSGTPFRALNDGEFIEEQVFSWTYSDEQQAKIDWGNKPKNPYLALPKMVMMTYQMSEDLRRVAEKGENNEFDLNEFFAANGDGEQAQFKYINEVQQWLNWLRYGGEQHLVHIGVEKPPMPYSDVNLLGNLLHTVWFLPSVAACFAMRNLLAQPQNQFYHDYKVVVAAGSQAGIGENALPPVRNAIGDNPLESKSITLSCGKLLTGISIPEWSGIFMLCNLKSPETYFQAAFRVQTPWTMRDDQQQEIVIKDYCYVFDFALNRALAQISEYSTRLDPKESNPEKQVAEFIHFLPVLSYDGGSMKQFNAADILDYTLSGITATLLARRWESAMLVNVDNDTLDRLRNNPEAMAALQKIEGFRSLNQDIATIINRTESVKEKKRNAIAEERDLTTKEKQEIKEEEKERQSLRKQIQEKLIKFATRVPVFMYLTDLREHSLREVIEELEPDLFLSVTGLTQRDFQLLVNLNVFNQSQMNDAVYKFKRYEDASLEYTGIRKHHENFVGGYDTVITQSEYMQLN